LKPFQDKYPINPSFEITKLLPESLPSTTEHPTAVKIITYPHAIRVAYKDVRELIPGLLESYADHVDVVMHMGMASGRRYYAAEQLGHRDGYGKNADLDLIKLPTDDGEQQFGDCPETLETSLDYEEVLRGWRRNVKGQDVFPAIDTRPSNDAGHYLCDYIYFNSLAWYARRSQKFLDGKVTARPVMFLHVPADSDAEHLEIGRIATVALIRAIAESWSISGRHEKTLPDPGEIAGEHV
jgi:pyroglutamyl-peptidase